VDCSQFSAKMAKPCESTTLIPKYYSPPFSLNNLLDFLLKIIHNKPVTERKISKWVKKRKNPDAP